MRSIRFAILLREAGREQASGCAGLAMTRHISRRPGGDSSLVFARVCSNAAAHMPRHTCFHRFAGSLAVLLLASLQLAAQGQTNTPAFELASLREDVRLLSQRLGELTLRIEQLERENGDLKTKASQTYVTLAQLNEAIADVQKTTQAALHEQKRETLQQVSVQLEKLANETQAAINALAKSAATRPAVTTPTFTEDYPKEGVSYTVQKGDTLSSIAHKTNAKMQDIINANKIADPTRLQVGQTLFIPQGK
jgi:LysM repeat protein